MNYEKIGEKYPKGYELLLKGLGLHFDGYYLCYPTGSVFNERDLFDFFDELLILLHIESYLSTNDFDKFIPTFKANVETIEKIYKIDRDIDNVLYTSEYFYDRTEAEEAGFTKCFEILERQIK